MKRALVAKKIKTDVLHLETEIYLIESQQKCFINPSGKCLIQLTLFMPPRTSEKMCHLVTVT